MLIELGSRSGVGWAADQIQGAARVGIVVRLQELEGAAGDPAALLAVIRHRFHEACGPDCAGLPSPQEEGPLACPEAGAAAAEARPCAAVVESGSAPEMDQAGAVDSRAAAASCSTAAAWEIEERALVEIPRWVSDIPRSHTVWWCGGFAACKSCGGIAGTDPPASRLLRGECKGAVASGSQGRLRKFFQGALPYGWTSWPDRRRGSQAVRAPFELEWDSASCSYMLLVAKDIKEEECPGAMAVREETPATADKLVELPLASAKRERPAPDSPVFAGTPSKRCRAGGC